MPDWRDRILKALTPGAARLTVAADPDGLLLEATLLEAVRERGFEIVTFEDPVAFRFDHESRFRSRWDRGEGAGLEVVVRTEGRDPAALPYDLVQAGRRLSFGLGDLFPALAYPVVASLDRSDLDTLHRAQEYHRPGQLGDDATRDFVLRHVFDFAPELVRRPSDLLRLLLRRHYRRQRLPRLLDERLADLLRQGGAFASWPLAAILRDRDAFFTFLQERWPRFLDRLAGGIGAGELRDVEEASGLAIGEPADLPFDHADVRVYIDNLFVEGMLRPAVHESGRALRGEWAAVGVRIDPGADRRRRLRRLAEAVRTTLPESDAHHRDWLSFACRWAELGVLLSETAAARRVLRAFIDWGVLVETGGKGLYRGTAKCVTGSGPITVWVLKAMLSAGRGTPQSPSALLRAPRLFPFEIALPSPAELETCGAFEVVRHGLDHEVLLDLTSTATPDRVCRS